MTEQNLIVSEFGADGTATLTLNAPQTLNALTEEMGNAFLAAISDLKQRQDIKLVFLSGAGRAFSSGGNMDFIKENCRRAPEDNKTRMVAFYKKFLSIAELPMPTIALINGPAVGAGLAFSLACDLRFSTRDAKMGLNFVRIGLTPGMGSTFLLPRVVGNARARELLFSGRLLGGEEAKTIGLVQEIFPDSDTLLREGRALANTFLENGPLAIRGTKRLLNRDWQGLDEALREEAAEQAIAFQGEEIHEGVTAIEVKRKPVFLTQR